MSEKTLTNIEINTYLLNREEAAAYLGMSPITFDKFIRNNDNLKRFMLGRRERYTIKDLQDFISEHTV